MKTSKSHKEHPKWPKRAIKAKMLLFVAHFFRLKLRVFWTRHMSGYLMPEPTEIMRTSKKLKASFGFENA